MNVSGGHDFLRQLVAALGLDGKPVRKVVIEAGINDVVKVYVQMFAHTDQADRVTEAAKMLFVDHVTVADDGTVNDLTFFSAGVRLRKSLGDAADLPAHIVGPGDEP